MATAYKTALVLIDSGQATLNNWLNTTAIASIVSVTYISANYVLVIYT